MPLAHPSASPPYAEPERAEPACLLVSAGVYAKMRARNPRGGGQAQGGVTLSAPTGVPVGVTVSAPTDVPVGVTLSAPTQSTNENKI